MARATPLVAHSQLDQVRLLGEVRTRTVRLELGLGRYAFQFKVPQGVNSTLELWMTVQVPNRTVAERAMMPVMSL